MELFICGNLRNLRILLKSGMVVKEKQLPSCFGDLDTVFPMGEDGLRCTPDTCMACKDKTKCLRAAMADSGGIGVREEIVDRAYASGRMGFLERWSRRKSFSRQRCQIKKTHPEKEVS